MDSACASQPQVSTKSAPSQHQVSPKSTQVSPKSDPSQPQVSPKSAPSQQVSNFRLTWSWLGADLGLTWVDLGLTWENKSAPSRPKVADLGLTWVWLKADWSWLEADWEWLRSHWGRTLKWFGVHTPVQKVLIVCPVVCSWNPTPGTCKGTLILRLTVCSFLVQ